MGFFSSWGRNLPITQLTEVYKHGSSGSGRVAGRLLPALPCSLARNEGPAPWQDAPARYPHRPMGGRDPCEAGFPNPRTPGTTPSNHYWECPAMKKVFTTGQVAKICKVAPRT